VDRARVRLFLLNFEKELFVHVSTLESACAKSNEKALEKARSHIRDRLTQLAPVFLKNKYMLGENLLDARRRDRPLLWRLDYYGIELSKNAAPLLKYAERIFSRPAYIEALTPSEKVMRSKPFIRRTDERSRIDVDAPLPDPGPLRVVHR
jgi:RNA polymerase-associated protein